MVNYIHEFSILPTYSSVSHNPNIVGIQCLFKYNIYSKQNGSKAYIAFMCQYLLKLRTGCWWLGHLMVLDPERLAIIICFFVWLDFTFFSILLVAPAILSRNKYSSHSSNYQCGVSDQLARWLTFIYWFKAMTS